MRRYVIIGSGAAGISAAESIHGEDPSASLTMLTDDPGGYYSRPGLGYYLSGEVPIHQLFPLPHSYFDELNLQIKYAPTSGLIPDEHQVVLKNGQKLPYDRLLIATGATATQPNQPGVDLKGVVKLDSLEDAKSIVSQAKRGKTAVVVGGGITALELVEGMHARGLHVHYFLRGDRYWSAVLDEAESHIVEARLKADGIIIHYNTNLAEIRGRNGQLTSVVAQSGTENEEIKCQMLGIAIGIRPRKELADAGKLKTQRGILVDANLQTSHPDIFAAGDVAQIFDPISKEHILDSLWGPAMEQGTIAGLNMSGCREIYQKLIPFNVTRLAGLVVTIIGQVGMESPLLKNAGSEYDANSISRGESEIWHQIPDALVAETYAGENHLRLYLSPTRLVGAVVLGDQAISIPIQHIIREKMDIQPLRGRLLEPGARLAELITSFWQERNPTHAAKIA